MMWMMWMMYLTMMKSGPSINVSRIHRTLVVEEEFDHRHGSYGSSTMER
jgi:hypothetical protein